MRTRRQPHFITAGLAAAVAVAIAFTGSVAATDRVITVQPGDTLSGIAARNGVTVDDLVALNGIANPNRIFAGQRLKVGSAPPAGHPAPQQAVLRTHRVAFGENLTWIARRHGTTIAAIAAANGISNPSYIRTGQVLVIPGGAPSRAAVTAPAGGSGMPASMAALVAKRQDVRDLIVAEANRQGVPPAFALAVAWQESGWQQGVVSSAGAIGVMQLLPATGEWVGGVMLGEQVNLHDAASNVRAGVRLLRHYLDRYGDRSLALAAYYQGQAATDRHGIYPVSRPYIASILRLEELFSR